MTYVYIDPAWQVSELSYWPEQEPIWNDDIGYDSLFNAEELPAWRLDLCKDGTLSLREAKQKPFNGVAICVYRHDDADLLREIQPLMCRLAYDTDDRLTHEQGRRWIFSWLTSPMLGTLWQVGAVQRIIHTYVSTGDVSAARAEGNRLAAIVEAAANALHDKHKKELNHG